GERRRESDRGPRLGRRADAGEDRHRGLRPALIRRAPAPGPDSPSSSATARGMLAAPRPGTPLAGSPASGPPARAATANPPTSTSPAGPWFWSEPHAVIRSPWRSPAPDDLGDPARGGLRDPARLVRGRGKDARKGRAAPVRPDALDGLPRRGHSRPAA